MLPPSYLDQMPDAFVQLWQQVEDEILHDVARRIGKMDKVTATANWQLWRYQQTEAVRNDVVKLLARYSGKSETAIRKLLLQAATEAMEREDAIYYHYDMEPTPFEENAALNNLLDAGARQTCGTWHNLTATTANTVTGAFERTLDAAWLKVSTGAFDYKTAVKQAVDSLADDMPMVTYPSGHKDSIEVAARRAVLTGVNQTTGKLQVARMDEMGCEFVETTAHGGARPSHAEWQGRRFHRGGAMDYKGKHYPDFEAATGYGTGAGLCGWNCRHTFFAVFPELGDPPQWTQEQLRELNARNIEWNGKKYTAYEISQMQRARERNVRRWKKRYLAEDAAGLDPTASAVRLKAARQSLAEFAQATGGRVDSARVSVPKFGRSEASRASAQARKVEPHKVQSTRGSGGASGQNGKTVRKVLGKVDTTNTKQVDALKNSFCSGYAKSDVEHAEKNITLNGALTRRTNIIIGMCRLHWVAGKTYTMYVKKVGGSASLGSGDGITFAYSLFATDYNHYFRGDTTSKNLDAYIARDVALVETELIFMLQCWREGTVFNDFKFQIEVVPGTTVPTTYTPYTGQTATLTLPCTIYGGTVDAVTGEGQNLYDVLTLTGEENWKKDDTYIVLNSATTKTNIPLNGVCSHFLYRYNYGGDSLFVDTFNIYLGATMAKKYALDEWKALLAAQYAAGTPVQICYKLAEPVPITATGAQPIPALSGLNTVLTNADSVAVTGRADPIKRITDLEDAVASMTTT